MYTFHPEVDWDFMGLGRLWAYNLNYLQWLDPKSPEKDVDILRNYLEQLPTLSTALEPYPTSLRIISLVRYRAETGLRLQPDMQNSIDSSIHAQARMLAGRPEYHILGNHLLENGFALFFAAIHLNDTFLFSEAGKILLPQLKEQILMDGAHFELSPMYHRIILERVLDALNLLKGTGMKDHVLWEKLCTTASTMLSWMENLTFSNGSMPEFNDSSESLSRRPAELIEYAARLGALTATGLKLGMSGYRMLQAGPFEVAVDAAPIGPDYIPGHAHSDMLTFELAINGVVHVVDTGISTYEIGPARDRERSTSAHNTIEIDGRDQSEMWGAFRVARRARIIYRKEGKNYVEAAHSGYMKSGTVHHRSFDLNENRLRIIDRLEYTGKKQPSGIFRVHFHPDIPPVMEGDSVRAGYLTIQLPEDAAASLKPYQYARGFNDLQNAICLELTFRGELQTYFQMTPTEG